MSPIRKNNWNNEIKPAHLLHLKIVMRLNSVVKLSIVLSVLFISIGDRVLPQPMNTASIQARETVNQFLNKMISQVTIPKS
ncbi:MAG: hypothetical protein Fur006_57280 [Coleofasciculaceae cyanobacterium]